MAHLRALYFIVPFFFFIGLWQGYEVDSRDLSSRSRTQIRVLIPKGAIPHHVFNEFENREAVVFVVEETDSEADLIEGLKDEKHKYDLVMVYNHQLDELPVGLKRVPSHFAESIKGDFYIDREYTMPFQWGIDGFVHQKKAKNPKSLRGFLNGDYRFTLIYNIEEFYSVLNRLGKVDPVDSIAEHSKGLKQTLETLSRQFQLASEPIPVGPNDVVQMSNGQAAKVMAKDKNLKFLVPKERASFWVRSLVIPEDSNHRSSALRFCEFLFEPATSVFIARNTWEASTNTLVETQEVSEMLKPSWLRENSIRTIEPRKVLGEQKRVFQFLVDSVDGFTP